MASHVTSYRMHRDVAMKFSTTNNSVCWNYTSQASSGFCLFVFWENVLISYLTFLFLFLFFLSFFSSYMNLKQCPVKIGYVGSQLSSLNLSNNRLIELPEELGLLRGLEELFLQYNCLEELPVCMSIKSSTMSVLIPWQPFTWQWVEYMLILMP